MPKHPTALAVAVVGDAATVAFLTWGLFDAPGGPAGVLESDSLLRLLLLRVAAVLVVALCGTWLLPGDPRLGGLFLIGTAAASALAIPSPFWAVPATLLGIAGALGAMSKPLHLSRSSQRAADVGGLACVCLAGLGLLVLAASLTLGATLTVVGAPSGLMTVYAWATGARVPARVGDATIPVPPPPPEIGLTPVPATTQFALAPASLHLAPGETASVVLNVTSDIAIQSIAFDMGFDPGLVSVQEVSAGAALELWASDHQTSVITLPGVSDPPPAPALANAGVGLLSGEADNVGPRSGTFAVLTIRAEKLGQTDLSLQNIAVYSRVDGKDRHHTKPDSRPPAVRIVVG
jgi:hypothetical protein